MEGKFTLSEDQKLFLQHPWAKDIKGWCKDQHPHLWKSMHDSGELDHWATKKVMRALHLRDSMIQDQKDLHPSQADELARDDMFSL